MHKLAFLGKDIHCIDSTHAHGLEWYMKCFLVWTYKLILLCTCAQLSYELYTVWTNYCTPSVLLQLPPSKAAKLVTAISNN